MKRYNLFIIFLIVIIHLFLNVWILNKSDIIRIGDETHYLQNSFEFAHLLNIQDVHGAFVRFSNPASNASHQNLFPFLSGTFLYAINFFHTINIHMYICLSNSLVLLVLLLGVYFFASLVFNSRVGLLAAILVSCSPIIFSYERMFMLDLPLTAMYLWVWFAYSKSHYFKKAHWTFVAGMLTLACFLIKEVAGIFMLPLLCVHVCVIILDPMHKKLRVRNTVLFYFPWIVLAGIFIYCSKDIFLHLLWAAMTEEWVSRSFFYYMQWCPFFTLYLGPLLMCISTGLLIYSVYHSRKKINVMLWGAFVIPVVALALLKNGLPRYAMPVIPFLFIITAEALFNITRKKMRRVLYCLLVGLGLAQFFLLSLSIPDHVLAYLCNGHDPKDKHAVLLHHGLLSAKKDPEMACAVEVNNYLKREIDTGKMQLSHRGILVSTNDHEAQLMFDWINLQLCKEYHVVSPVYRTGALLMEAIPGMPHAKMASQNAASIDWLSYARTSHLIIIEDATGTFDRQRNIFAYSNMLLKNSLLENEKLFKRKHSFSLSDKRKLIVYENSAKKGM
ncbi:MAG: glycosyltransferase family 39 protein [Candidatus Omnitrophica bacterium]|nr:glycosyltransferase family 39 protein [Candidatus Omnitrophota bacterium]